MQFAIEFVDVAKRYGAACAVSGVSAAVPQGHVVGLLGHNGAGKTTLIKLALGLISPTDGGVEVFGQLSGTSEFHKSRASIGYLPENVAFYQNLTGRQVIEYFACLKRVSRADAGALLDQVGLASVGDRRVREYSKGMRQRLGLAQALLASPRLLILDEPTAGLDPLATQQFFETIAQLQKAGKTILISSHLLAELEHHIDRALILHGGRVVAQGTLPEMYKSAGLAETITAQFTRKPNGLLSESWTDGLLAPPRVKESTTVEFDVPALSKMCVMRRLIDSGAVSDISVQEPSLVRLYATVCADRLGRAMAKGTPQ